MIARKKPGGTSWPETLWTIGHSTRSLDEFIALLKGNAIEVLADVRHFPGSRKYPHFNVEPLRQGLHDAGIDYEPFTELGGRRKVQPDSPNTAWRHPAFRGYADYMQTETFHDGIERLKVLASKQPTAIMCSEAVWWRCHRRIVADYLLYRGRSVIHLMGPARLEPATLTRAAMAKGAMLAYPAD
jgi:uncharacterized protein (DUF488 family)